MIDALGPVHPPSTPTGRFAQWFIESRAHRVICIVVGIWLLNAFDLSLTIMSNEHGMLDEQNPLARAFLRSGPLSLMLYKLGLVLIGSYPLLRFRETRIADLGAVVVFVTYAILAIRWSQCLDLYSHTFLNSANYADLQSAMPMPQ